MTQDNMALAFWSMIPFAPWLVYHAPTSIHRLLVVTALICELQQQLKSSAKDKCGKGGRKGKGEGNKPFKYRARW